MSLEDPNFLKQKYWDKEAFREVSQKSSKKKERLNKDEDVSVSQKPKDQISSYIERIKRVAERKDPRTGKKGKLFLEASLYPNFIIKSENISDDYIKNILLGNFAEMKGYDRDKLRNPEIKEQVLKMFETETYINYEAYQVPAEEKEQLVEQTIKDQRASLDRWFEYLTGPEAENYPDELRYWAFAEMLKLGAQDRNRQDFNKRYENTAAPFPELNQQALSKALDEIERKYKKESSHVHFDDKDKQKDFEKRLESENFGKLYGWALDYVNSLKLPTERLPITQGEWRKFAKGSDAKELADTLQGFNTGWCIAGEGTAESYLGHSDIWIYFSQDEKEENSIPRAAVVTDGSRVSEVRGIIQTKEVKQHLDDYIAPIVEEKLKTLPGGEIWQSGMEDMKKLAEIHFKHIQKQPLDKDELVFLYELGHPIQSMGYGQDPRIGEIRNQRNPKEDTLIIFECTREQIAYNPKEINKNTKAYIGELVPHIFQILPDTIEFIYRKFPENRIEKKTVEIGGYSKEELKIKIRNKIDNKGRKYKITKGAESMIDSPDFKTEEKPRKIDIVIIKVEDLGFILSPNTNKIFEKIKKVGLVFCPSEVGPNLRIKFKEVFKREQSQGEYLYIGIKPIVDYYDDDSIFCLDYPDEIAIMESRADSRHIWSLDSKIVFCFPETES
jgi:hypothetical protein